MLTRTLRRLAGLVLSIALVTSFEARAACPTQFCTFTCQLCLGVLTACHHGGQTGCVYAKTQPTPTSNPCSLLSDICAGTQECWTMLISYHYTDCNDEFRAGEVTMCCRNPS